MPVRVKPPPAETGDTVSPGCASFEMATPLKGARMMVSSRFVFAERNLLLGDAHLFMCGENARVERVDLCLGGLELGLSHEPVLDQPRQSRERQLRFVETHFVLANATPRGLGLCLRKRQRRPQRRVIEPSEHLTLPDRHPFLDVHLDELAGDLRRNRRAAAGGHVARGVEHGGLRTGGALGHHRCFNLERLFAGHPAPASGAGEADHEQKRQPYQPPPRRPVRFAI